MNSGSSFSGSKVFQLWLQRIQPFVKQHRSTLNTWHNLMDHVYSTGPLRMGLANRFFKLGWGGQSLEILREFIEKNLQMLQNNEENSLPWPPAIVEPQWRTVWETRRAVLQEGVFATPVEDDLKELLPPESLTARVRLLMPRSSCQQDMACVLHLAGTGDHGFDMRLKLGAPLLEQGVATMVLESPFYGQRRPRDQKGSRLRYVSDLLALGRTTIEESRALLHWAREDRGFGKLGICGLSMGGVHASMVGSLHPFPIAVTPLLAPHSAAVAFCEGVLSLTTDWDVLSKDTTLSEAFTSRVNLHSASGRNAVKSKTVASDHIRSESVVSDRVKSDTGFSERLTSEPLINDGTNSETTVSEAAGTRSRDLFGGQAASQSDEPISSLQTSAESLSPGSQAPLPESATLSSSSQSPDADPSIPSSTAESPNSTSGRLHCQSETPSSSLPNPNLNPAAQGPVSTARSQSSEPTRNPPPKSPNPVSALASEEAASVAVAAVAAGYDLEETRSRLREVLSLTDVTRFPCPKKPEAVILVAATNDAYIPQHSVKSLQKAWPGMEVRWVVGGHVSSYLLHGKAFRQAILDSLSRI